MAATRLIALHVNKGKTVAQCLADRTDYSQNAAKPMMANLSAPMSVIQRQRMKNFCFPNGSTNTLPADSRRTISSHTRYASLLSREKSRRKKRTRSAMKQRCDGQRANTLSPLRPTSTNLIFTTISFIIRLRWMPHGNSKTSFFPVWRCKDSVIWFAWNTGCPLLHRSRIGSARKELFIPSYCVLHEPLHPFPKIPDNSQPIKPI